MESYAPVNMTSTMTDGFNQFNKFVINPTKITPAINLMAEKQYLLIKGRSCPDNAQAFYSRVYESLDSYLHSGKSKLTVYIKLEYFNTSSAKCIYGLLKKLQKFDTKELNIVVNWYYENDDEDMMEAGEDFSDSFKFKFNLVPFQLRA